MTDLAHSSDLDLARRIGAGDRGAAEALFRTHVDRLYEFVHYRLGGDRGAAEDVVQDVFADPFTDSAGRFELRGLAVGRWRVGVSGPGGEGASAEVLVLVVSGERVEFELR